MQQCRTENHLPKELQDKAIVLAGQLSWPASDALQVVEWLGMHGYEVVGAELWREKEGRPLFVAASDYSPSPGDAVTPESIAWCAHKAKAFITKFRHEPEAVFNITWGEPVLTELHNAKLALKAILSTYSQVRLITDKYQSQGAQCFDIGYIIEVYPDNKYEVEFSDQNGSTTAQIVARGEELQVALEGTAIGTLVSKDA